MVGDKGGRERWLGAAYNVAEPYISTKGTKKNEYILFRLNRSRWDDFSGLAVEGRSGADFSGLEVLERNERMTNLNNLTERSKVRLTNGCLSASPTPTHLHLNP